MLIRIFLLLVIINSSITFATSLFLLEKPENYNSEREVFSEISYLYKNPSFDSEKMVSLSIGQKVQVGSTIEIKSKRNGFNERWIKAMYRLGDKTLFGNIWIGDLALTSVSVNHETRLLVGILGMKNLKDLESYEKIAEARLIQAGKIITRSEFQPIDFVLHENNYYHVVNGNILEKKGFSPPLDLISFNFNLEGSDIPNGEILFIWNGKKLIVGPVIEIINSNEYVVDVSYSYILPSHIKGKKNCIIVSTRHTPNGSDKDTKLTVNYIFYKWDGESLLKSQKCD